MKVVICVLVLLTLLDSLHGAPRKAVGTYDYTDLLYKNHLFYEAQRSGNISSFPKRVSWRVNSALNDKGSNGEDLTGGWYDAGDHVKFGQPMAYSAAVLAWGVIEFEAGYSSANVLSYARENLRWVCDYFIKAHSTTGVFYGQVGNGDADHSFWGRPEDMTMARPAYKIDSNNKGTEVLADTAAALAATSIVFKTADPTYSQKLLTHAKDLYAMGVQNKGSWTGSSPFYTSGNGYEDELVWAAIWLYKATNDNNYLTDADKDLGYEGWAFGWDDKRPGNNVLLAKITGKQLHTGYAEKHFDTFIGLPATPGGLTFRSEWGSLRYATTTSFIAFVYVDYMKSVNRDTAKQQKYYDFAVNQVHYALGDNPGDRSFVVGYGKNPPTRPHHRGASCPLSPAVCNNDNLNSPNPNPQVLYGALVGGPGSDDSYTDSRTDYQKNEVATDYNAGITGAAAKLVIESKQTAPARTDPELATTGSATTSGSTTTGPATTGSATTSATTRPATTSGSVTTGAATTSGSSTLPATTTTTSTPTSTTRSPTTGSTTNPATTSSGSTSQSVSTTTSNENTNEANSETSDQQTTDNATDTNPSNQTGDNVDDDSTSGSIRILINAVFGASLFLVLVL